MIAGFESCTDGEIKFDGKIINNLKPSERNVAMAFEGYALYPPLTVKENIAFGLIREKISKSEITKKVDEIMTKRSKVYGIRTEKDFIPSDIVISNADIVPTYTKLLGKEKAPKRLFSQERSSSALIFYWGIRKTFPDLDLHNIFFSADYKNEFKCIFEDQIISNDPTVYINISSKEESNDAPTGCENWFTMVNAPRNNGQDWDVIIKQTRINIIKKLSRVLKVDLNQLINYESILDPRDIEKNTQSYQGSIYGAASHSKFSAFLRHPNFSSSISNLYFCGGSVHPGGGIPLCLWSGKITADLIHKTHWHEL